MEGVGGEGGKCEGVVSERRVYRVLGLEGHGR